MIFKPASDNPLKISRSSRVVHPPGSMVPVAGAKAGLRCQHEHQNQCFLRTWIENININTQIDEFTADRVLDLLNDLVDSELV